MVVTQRLTAEERALVASYWWQRAAGEMTSWVGWGHVLDDMRVLGSPLAILDLAERAVADEWKHSLWCRDFAVAFGHAGGEPKARSTRKMTLSGATERENRILRIALCAFSETVGTFTLQGVRKVVTEPELRKQNQLHLTDELQHSRAAWAHLFTLNDDARAVVRRALPRLFDILSVAYRGSSERSDELLVPYGYFTPEVLRRAHEEALREVILPGLSHLGITEAA